MHVHGIILNRGSERNKSKSIDLRIRSKFHVERHCALFDFGGEIHLHTDIDYLI